MDPYMYLGSHHGKRPGLYQLRTKKNRELASELVDREVNNGNFNEGHGSAPADPPRGGGSTWGVV